MVYESRKQSLVEWEGLEPPNPVGRVVYSHVCPAICTATPNKKSALRAICRIAIIQRILWIEISLSTNSPKSRLVDTLYFMQPIGN